MALRTDTVTQISSSFKMLDGTAYDNLNPVTLGMGDSLYLKIELWNSVPLGAGSYPLSFKIYGSG